MSVILSQIIVDIIYLLITIIGGIATYYVKKFIDSKQDLIDKQKEALKQKLGDEQYNKDLDIAERVVLAVEQMGKEFNWEGAVKHSKATEIITQKTGLSSGDIYDIIKSVCYKINLKK